MCPIPRLRTLFRLFSSEGASGHSLAVRPGQPGWTALTEENIETLPVVHLCTRYIPE